jgi:Zn-dependent peptidase ImmA (M78 family)
MNNHRWEIVELSRDVITKQYREESGTDTIVCFGYTDFCYKNIYINRDMCYDMKRKTLMHELLHCYIDEYCSMEQNEYDEEAMCNISANSHDIIHKIVDEYFKK